MCFEFLFNVSHATSNERFSYLHFIEFSMPISVFLALFSAPVELIADNYWPVSL